MSGGEVRKASARDMQLVQNLIVHCMQLYMNQKEVVDTLSFQAKIEPSFIEHVWQILEEENREFFKAYHARLTLKNQILVFNDLLEKQVELMQKASLSGVATLPVINGSNSSAANQTPSFTSPLASTLSRPDTMLCNGDFSSAFSNSRPSGQQGSCLDSDQLLLTESMNASTSVLSAHDCNAGRIAGMNETIGKAEPNYRSNSGFPFGNDSSILEAHQPPEDASAGSFCSTDFVGQPLQSNLLGLDTSSLGFGQSPQNFSFSDLADDFTHCADILENYDTPPCLPPGSDNISALL